MISFKQIVSITEVFHFNQPTNFATELKCFYWVAETVYQVVVQALRMISLL